MLPLWMLSRWSRDLVDVSSKEGNVRRRERSISSASEVIDGYL
jgi:hypothetical protein